MARSRRNAAVKAINGANSAGITTLCARPCHRTPSEPDCTSAAPTSPPISAWDELDGRPNHHVRRFHAIAPKSAASTVCCVARFASMRPLATFFATAVVTKAPARFATAAISTATRGVTARVPTEVAIAFAVSWKPFVKSNPRATTMTMTRSASFNGSTVLHDDGLEDVGRVLARVDGLLERLVDVLPADDRDRVVGGAEELGHGLAVQPVALVLELAELRQLPARVLEAVETRDRLLELGRGPKDHVPLRLRRRAVLLEAVADDVPRRLVDVVADVVERAGEPVHVVAVERRDEGAVEETHDLVREAVALVLELLDVSDPLRRAVRRLSQQVDERSRDRDRIRRGLVEEVVELLALRDERDPRHRLPPWSVAARLLTGL